MDRVRHAIKGMQYEQASVRLAPRWRRAWTRSWRARMTATSRPGAVALADAP